MAQTSKRAQKTLQRIGVARANLACLDQLNAGRAVAILARYAEWYRIAPRGMTRASSLKDATLIDSEASLVASLQGLLRDASFIRGFTPLDARRINPHLRVLAEECTAFASAQARGSEVTLACRRFLDGGMGSGAFAGSALPV
jgi:hypothetical protein